MKASEIRQKKVEELRELLNKLDKDYQGIVMDVLQKKEKNVKKPRLIKKDIARIKSVLKEKEIINE